jgi:hypothetical protein
VAEVARVGHRTVAGLRAFVGTSAWGRAQALREAVLDVARELGLAVDGAREAWLAGLEITSLRTLPARLLRERRWPA